MGKRGQGGKSELGNRSTIEGIGKTPETIVFEGYRASVKSGKPRDLKLSGGKKKSKSGTRSSKRASEWKKSGGKKGRD
jgi:nucleolar protein 12